MNQGSTVTSRANSSLEDRQTDILKAITVTINRIDLNFLAGSSRPGNHGLFSEAKRLLFKAAELDDMMLGLPRVMSMQLQYQPECHLTYVNRVGASAEVVKVHFEA